MTTLRIVLLLAASSIVAVNSLAQSVDAPSDPAQLAWSWLIGFDGAYRTEADDGGIDTVAYQLISRGTALTEIWGTPDTRVELTVFHMDDGQLVATHYCARGTQATMMASVDIDTRTITFSLRSILNLDSQSSAHNSGFSYVFNEDGTVRREETWLSDGEATVYGLSILDI